MSEDVYNQTLFRGGLRRFVHMGRFHWVARRMAELDPNVESVVELGCYDGRILEHVRSPVRRYVGYDANWGGGLDLARTKWSKNPHYEFRSAQSAGDIDRAERFDVGVCMETLEHVADELVDDYIDALATVVQRRLYVTVPNEKFFPFVVKHLYHAVVGGGEQYAPAEVVNAALGRMNRVARDGHKGFDYEALIARLERRFVVDRIEGQPVPELPPWVSTGVSIIARPRVRS